MPDQSYWKVPAGSRTGSQPYSDACVTRRNPNKPKPPLRLAEMRQPLVRPNVRPEIAKRIREAAERKWPGQGQRAVDRMAREMIRRNLRRSDG